ncbi:MAG: NADH-quinone oxidoreductase subunit N [Planctomycetaceae bacterium]
MISSVDIFMGSVSRILPELVLIATACVQFLAGPFLVTSDGQAPAGLRHRWAGLTLTALLFSLVLWNSAGAPAGAANMLYSPFQIDGLVWFIRGLTVAVGIVLLLLSWNQIPDNLAAETHGCLLITLAGVSLVSIMNDLVYLFLALELVSIPTYVLMYLSRKDAVAQEAVTKYFLLSVFSSALLLFGFSYLYGVTGSTHLLAIQSGLQSAGSVGVPVVLVVPTLLIVAALGFRLSAVPFHFYAPDVFQGTSYLGAALLAVVPKIVGVAAIIRIFGLLDGAGVLVQIGAPALWIIAAITMLVGNVFALLQTNIKRLLAYSSIAHAGYLLVGLAIEQNRSAPLAGVQAVLFYLAVYGAMTAGVFAILVYLNRADRSMETVSDLAGLSQTHPAAALMTAIFLFSLTGLPPTAGFLGKLNLFMAAWSEGTSSGRWLAGFMAANAAIGAWYYLRLVATMYLDPPAKPVDRSYDVPSFVGVVLCAAAVLGLFAVPHWLWQWLATVAAV